MANKPLKSIKFPGLSDTYAVPEVDDTLAVTGAAADAKKVGDEISDIKADLSEISDTIYTNITTTWRKGLAGADGKLWSGNGVTSAIVTLADTIFLVDTCKAAILLYSGDTYLGKLNASGGIDKASGNWKYFTGNVDIAGLLNEFSADGFVVSVLPTDETIISDEGAQDYGNAHCSMAYIKFADTVHVNEKLTTLKSDVDAKIEEVESFTTMTLTMQEVYERKEVSRFQNSYAYYTQENVARARVKQKYIQKVPDGATSAVIYVSPDALCNGKYKVGWAFYTEDYKQIDVKGWYMQETTVNIDSIPSDAVYFMYYYATNSASEIDLSEIQHDKNSITFNGSDYNYAYYLLHPPVSSAYAKDISEINNKVMEMSNQVDEANKGVLRNTQTYIFSVNHRGYSTDTPENTLPAFIRSKQIGFRFVETDVVFTSDNVPVLLHDSTINRTARNADGTTLSETVYINNITYAQALEYDFGIWKGEKWAGTKIPSFEEFIVLCKKLSLHPFIELKDVRNGNIWTEEHINIVAGIIKKIGMQENVSFISFSPTALRRMGTIFPKARLGVGLEGGYTETEFSALVSDAASLKTDDNNVIVSVSYARMTSEYYARLQAEELSPMIWTVNDPNVALAMNDMVIGALSDSLDVGRIVENNILSSVDAI